MHGLVSRLSATLTRGSLPLPPRASFAKSGWIFPWGLPLRCSHSLECPLEAAPTNVSTPLLRHWASVRRQYPQYVLLYQVGDFFECFKEDALTLSEVLGVALTRRGVGKDATPMAGIPVRSLEAHLYRLIQAGLRVALCEQVEPSSPKARRLVQRRVTRLVTPGTFVESVHASNENNFLVSIVLPLESFEVSRQNGKLCERMSMPGQGTLRPPEDHHEAEYEHASLYYGVSWIDLSTGNEINCSLESCETVAECISRLQPREVLLRSPGGRSLDILSSHTALKRALPDQCLITYCDNPLNSMEINNLLLGDVTYQERSAVEALLSYIQHIREPARGNVVTSPIVPKTMLQGFDSPIQIMPAIRRFETHRFMRMDVSTRRALELHRSWRDPSSKQGSLLAAIDATVTASGSRLLSMRLACPLMDPEAIDSRLDAVEFFLRHRAIARELRRGLQNVMDIERTTQRIALSCRVTHDEHVSRPVDGHSLRHPHDNTVTPFASSQMQNQIRDLIALGETLGRALHIRDFIWKKHAAALDQKDRCVQAVQRQMERICCDRVFSILTAAFVDISGPLPTLMSTTQQPTSESTSRPGESVASTDSINFHSSSQASEHHSMLNSSMPRRQLGAIRPGFSAELDAARTEWEHTESSMNELEQLYRRLFGLRTLRVRNNNLVGWYLEVTRRDASRHAVFRQAQIHGKWEQFAPILSAAGDTKFAAVDASAIVSKMGYNLTEDAIKRLGETRNTARFRTRLLEHQEAHRLRAESRFIQAQLAVLSELSQRCAVEPVARDCIRETSAALSELDVAAGLAQVAHEHHYCRPILHRVDAEKPRCLIRIVNGRHPTVERSVQNFVPNSCYLEISNGEEPSSPSMLLLTSANASGKSTYLRQVALITILAQIGSFVPADFCELHPADGVYARVGAASGDDLVSARSTFFVEMEETAAILRQATRQSLVVLDEVGRGTSSEDGTAIGEAVATALAPRCRTLFATHYHEISRRIQNPSHPVSKYTQCVTTRVERDPETGALTFSYRLCDGVASSSFGIEVARLAGLPEPVLRQAESIVKSNKTQALGVRSTG